MSLIICWLVFPVVLTAVALGWGVLVERAGGFELPVALLPGTGLAAVIVVAGFTTATDATAELTVPLIAIGAVIGLVLRPRGRPSPWAVAAGVAVFAVFAAPIVLSGAATFAGYIKLDDTATWMAFTDRVMEHGRDLGGLAPSTYEATLEFNIGDGYPVGAFLPLGTGSELVGQDVAWVIQPYMAWLAAVLAVTLYELAARAVESRAVRAGIAFIAAQPALLYGYYLWGGIKEISAAVLIGLIAALAARLDDEEADPRRLIALAVAGSGLLAVLTVAGAVWIVPALAAALALAARKGDLRIRARQCLMLAGLVLVGCIPLLAAGAILPPTSSPLDSGTAQGNLLGPLSYLQAFGIWPVGDFRLTPSSPEFTYVAITVLLAAAAFGVRLAWRRRPALLLYASSAVIGTLILILAGSPWVEAKAMATASPAFLLMGLVGCVALMTGGRQVEGAFAAGIVVIAVLLSTALAYTEVILAPRDQLVELEEIGHEISGEGPTLISEYQPYGARHFLRDGDPEAISELRRRPIELRAGGVVPRGRSADIDELKLDALLVYRTLVLRRSPAQSRPPAPFELVRSDDYYEVWQQPERPRETVVEHQPLGSSDRRPALPIGTAGCADVRELARLARPGDELVAAAGEAPLRVSLRTAEIPNTWRHDAPDESTIFFRRTGMLSAPVTVTQPGSYEVWVGGSVRGELSASIDGEMLGEAHHRFNNLGEYIGLGAATLASGKHTLLLDYSVRGLSPGGSGRISAAGPLVLGRSAAQTHLERIPPSRSDTLCGRPLDWIELVRPMAPEAGG